MQFKDYKLKRKRILYKNNSHWNCDISREMTFLTRPEETFPQIRIWDRILLTSSRFSWWLLTIEPRHKAALWVSVARSVTGSLNEVDVNCWRRRARPINSNQGCGDARPERIEAISALIGRPGPTAAAIFKRRTRTYHQQFIPNSTTLPILTGRELTNMIYWRTHEDMFREHSYVDM